MTDLLKVRLDKWLWAARFYKTRALAKSAIEGGKVQCDGQKSKPGKLIQIDDVIKLRQGFDEKTVTVLALSENRGPASVAQTLYQESAESIQKREEIAQMRKLSAPTSTARPDKKQRRLIHRFKNIHDYNPDRES